MRLYYHKTDGGAEYLMDKYTVCPNGSKEGVFEGANIVIRIDGDIGEDAEITMRGVPNPAAAPALVKAARNMLRCYLTQNAVEEPDDLGAADDMERALALADAKATH